MRKITVEDAVGETLCHDMTGILEDGSKGVRFKRGHIIEHDDIPELLKIGKSHVFVWEPEADEVHEEDAGFSITRAVSGENVVYSGPSEGKFLISAASDGLFSVNSEALAAINAVDDFTIACRPGRTAVKKGDKLAGARIVPLVTKSDNVQEAVKIATDHFPVFSIKPFRPLKTGVIITGSEVYYGLIEDKFEAIMQKKLSKYKAEVLGYTKCPDELSVIMSAIENYMSQDAELILLTGGMSVDPDDLTPTAIRRSGARVITHGVPMQPGNMLMMGYLGKSMLIGVPGASMHSSVTSLDIFLPRIFAGEEILKEDITRLGEGGFCLGCAKCNYPVCYFGQN